MKPRRAAILIGIIGIIGIAATLSPTAPAAPPAFSDATAAAEIETWQAPGGAFQFSVLDVSPMIGGGAAGDFDGDGRTDLYVVTGGSAPDRLYLNDGDGTFTDVASDAGLGARHMGVGAAAGDYDNDGDLDLFVTSYGTAEEFFLPAPGQHKLWRNNGDGTFTDVAAVAGLAFSNASVADGWGAAFGDVDLDGDLDLFVPQWLGGVGNAFFRNDGDGTFTDATDAAGLGDTTVRGFAARFVDMDGDRYPELLVAADFGTSRYYVNDGDGTFTDVTAASGTGLDANGMGQAVADLDRDGHLDWYVTSIYSLNSGMGGVPGTGNMLYRGLGNHAFAEVGAAAGVRDGGWGWGTLPVDVDHDGRLDLVETNGWRGSNGEGAQEWHGEASYLFHNEGELAFVDVAATCGFVHTHQGRGVVRLDYDEDGDQDIVIFANDGPLTLMRNDLAFGADTHWIRVRLDTTTNTRLAPHGYGTRVAVTADGETRISVIAGGSSYLSQSELSAHVGLGTSTTVDEIEVRWNDGQITTMTDLAADRTVVIVAPARVGDLDEDGIVGFVDLLELLGVWGRCEGAEACRGDLDGDGEVGFADLIRLLAAWG